MKITRFYTTEAGESQFTEIDISIEHAQRDADGNILRFSKCTTGKIISHSPVGIMLIQYVLVVDFEQGQMLGE